MYYIDSTPRTVRAFDYDIETGKISNERVIITVAQDMGAPDGMAIDTEGMLWIAHFGGSCVRRWHPETAEVLETIDLPASQITACTFGGKDLGTLFITSAAVGLDDAALKEQPHAGGLFAVKTTCQGMPSFKFAG